MVSQNKLKKLIKNYEKNISYMNEIINSLKIHGINNKSAKWKKHAPLSEYSDSIEYILLDNDKISIKFEKNDKINDFHMYNNNNYNKLYPHSFSFSEKSLDEHKSYIINKITECINFTKLKIHDLKEKFKNNMCHTVIESLYNSEDILIIKNYKSKFRDTCDISYDEIYILGTRPQAFIQIKGKKLQVATSYIIALSHNKWNIFFDINYDLFATRDIMPIKKFNEDPLRKITIENIFYIIERLNNHISVLPDNFEEPMSWIDRLKNNIIAKMTVNHGNAIIHSGNKESTPKKLFNIV
jgi:hypothetical protein